MRKGQTSRRDFLKAFGWGVATLSLTPWTGGCKKPVQSKNVLFIAVDDLNDWANCLGGRPGVHTPNLDRLASRGVLFTNAHCAAPACNPSRTSVFTGISPSSSGIYFNRQYWRESPVLKKAVTIPEYFRSQGYTSIGCGKLFHCLSWIRISYGRDGNDPNVWDSYFPSKTRPMPDFVWPSNAMKDEFETVTWTPLAGAGTEGRPPYYFDWGPLVEGDENTSDFKVVDWAAKEIQKKHDKPFFLAAGIFRPHIPWFVPKKYFDLYPLEDIFLPEIQENDLEDCSEVGKSFCRREWQKWILRNNQWKPAVQAYLASISFADARLGHLIEALDRSGHAQDTIVVLWSDHGMHIGEKEHWEKFTLWEESTRVPLLFVVPGMTKPGGRCEQPVSLLDIYPTLVELTGEKSNPGLDGQSLVPLLKDPGMETGRAVVTTYGYRNHGIRSLHWRFIRYQDGSEELYDHRTDPFEFINLASRPEYTDIKEKLATWLPKVDHPLID